MTQLVLNQVMSGLKRSLDGFNWICSRGWNSWEQIGLVHFQKMLLLVRVLLPLHVHSVVVWINGGSGGPVACVRQTSTQPIEQDVIETVESGVKERTGTQY